MLVLLGIIIGACIGSFIGCAWWRLPRGQSLLNPPSSCPACGHRLRWYENVPVASYLAQRGRARCCNAALSSAYILFESLCAVAGGLMVIYLLP